MYFKSQEVAVKGLLRSGVTILVSLLLLSAVACGQHGDRITVSGAWALYPMMVRWADEYQQTHPSAIIDVSAGGAGKGIADTLSGTADIGMVSRALSPEEIDQGAFAIAVTKDAVFPMISADNPLAEQLLQRGIHQEQLAGIFIRGDVTTWGQVSGDEADDTEIHLFTRSDASGAAEVWAQFLGGRQEDLLGIGVYGDPGILEAVIKDPAAIGYNNLGYAYDNASGRPVDSALVLAIDVNGNGQVDAEEKLETRAQAVQAVAEGRYPSPPARDLFLVTHGKPDGATKELIRWILTEGQQHVDEAGYVQLSAEQLQAELEKVD